MPILQGVVRRAYLRSWMHTQHAKKIPDQPDTFDSDCK